MHLNAYLSTKSMAPHGESSTKSVKDIGQWELRWGVFNSVVPLTEAFGMYLSEPGKKHTTRVTLIAKLRFGSESGFIAKMGSEIPFVLKAGMQSGFMASVEIARAIKGGKYPI